MSNLTGSAKCPRCRALNRCSMAVKKAGEATPKDLSCWCQTQVISAEAQAHINQNYPQKIACLCQTCLRELNEQLRSED